MMRNPVRTTSIWTALGVLAALALVPVLAAPAGATPTSGPATTQWAYGNSWSYNGSFQWNTDSNGMTLSGDVIMHAYFSWVVILTEKNTSASNISLEAQKAQRAELYVSYCSPNCQGTPRVYLNLTVVEWEKDVAFANLTTNATVTVQNSNGSTEDSKAMALINASGLEQGNFTETAVSESSGMVRGQAYLTASRSANASLALAPPLALVPLNVGEGDTWTSTSHYNLSGAYSGVNRYFIETPRESAANSRTVGGTLNSNGLITLTGSDERTVNLQGDGLRAVVPALHVLVSEKTLSPVTFGFNDGIFLSVSGSDIFESGSGIVESPMEFGTATAVTSEVDFTPFDFGHVGLLASQINFGDDSTLGESSDMIDNAGGASALAAPAQAMNQTIQGEPMSVAQAQGNFGALVGSSSSGAFPWKLVVLGLGLVAAVAVVVGVVVARRRQPPMSAGLVTTPGGMEGTAPRSSEPISRTPSPGSEEDPLGNLW
jgi:hypothetical protein